MLNRFGITAYRSVSPWKKGGIAAAALLGAFWAYAAWHPAAPDATFTTLAGARIAVADWRGHPALVTFWASDCATCLKEIPTLKDLYRRYAPRGLHMVAVAMSYDMPSHVVGLAKDWQLPYAVALDPLGENARAFGGVQWTPTTLLIGPDGRIQQRSVGDFDPQALAEHIESLL